MRNYYAFLLVLFSAALSHSQIVHIPDAALKNKLLTYTPVIDTNSDGEIQASEALAVTQLDVSNSYIWDMTGIAAFANLTSLNCSGSNSFENLDVSNMTALQELNCSRVSLYHLTLPAVSNIVSLDCSGCLLNAINLSSLSSNLNTLKLTGSFTSINLAPFTQLITLDLGVAPIAALDLSTLVNLKNLAFSNNQTLPSIDLSALVNLETLDFTYNNFSTINFPPLLHLKKVTCNQNQTTSFDVSALVNLTDLKFEGNYQIPLNAFDVSALTHLVNLECIAGGLTTLNISNLTDLVTLNCSENNLTALDVSNLVNLTALNCSMNSLNTLDVSNLTHLTSLKTSSNNLSTIDVSNLTDLLALDCGYNNLTTLDVSNLIHLTTLDFSHNELIAFSAGLPELSSLICDSNALTTLDISNLSNLKTLIANSNQLTAIDFTNLTKLRNIVLSNNLFTSLDFSKVIPVYPYPFHQVSMGVKYQCQVGGNPNLTYLNLKNGVPVGEICGFGGACRPSIGFKNCDNLQYLCIDEFNLPYIGTILPTTQVNSYCSISPGGTYNTIAGTFSFDTDNNGCDANDYHFPDGKIKIDDGTITGAAFTNSAGNYSFFTQAGSFVISSQFENPYYTISPPSATINFADIDSHTQTQNFCVVPNGVHYDVEITILPVKLPRPGFDAGYQLVYKNKGNQTLSGNIDLTFEDAVLDFVSANPAPNNQSLNTLNWAYTNLSPFESRTIDFVLNVNSPQETPSIEIGDILNFSASIDPVSGDETMGDNTFSLAQTVLGSYDPNDKTCLEGNTIAPEKVGDYLHYVIRFQNSGTAAAENVVVKDMIDTAHYDIASLQLTDSSHPQVTRITGNKVEFIFENINLPAESADEPGSHGYVAFKIKTKNNLVIGNTVSNKAGIYFDYNFPIITNTASTTVALLANNAFEDQKVAVFPNPVKDQLTITAKDKITSVQLYDIQGRLVETSVANDTNVIFNMAKNTTGIYFVKIYTDMGVKVEKIIKE